MPLASIVVPSRGGAGRLPRLFESLRQQTEQDVEMIVVIDGDTDDSESAVRRLAEEAPVRSIVFPENRGRAAALNAGFFDAKGDVLIRADDDLELEPDFVEHHVRLHDEAPRGVIAMCRDVFPRTPYATAYGVEADVAIRSAAFDTPPERTWEWWSGNVSSTRDDFHAVGGYDESFRAYGWEDVEWGYRLHRLGREILIAPGFTTLHHGPVTSAAERLERAFASGAAYAKFIEKHGPVLPQAEHPTSLWNTLVAVTARAATPRTVRTAGHLIDRHVERLPHAVGHKVVALGIQASSRAGRRRSGR
ncbi:glycosyltransferase family 2 protein [Nocardioides sp.]|uniref:glycosyltransferase family 2 protein n=1 Tax=Nocardioides sp. TaxID=35761 RepID=UPI00286D8E74|nr:glycosyltransferase family 2 protein [Nocardioides sp.]